METKLFTPGMLVKFIGLSAGKIKIPVIEGQLVKNDRNTTVKGVMSIVGDKHGMLFMPDGTIYCHGQYGPMLEILTHEEVEDTPRVAMEAEVEKFANEFLEEHSELMEKLKESGD